MCSFYGNDPLPLVFIHVFLAKKILGVGKRKQGLVKNSLNKKRYLGMGGVK